MMLAAGTVCLGQLVSGYHGSSMSERLVNPLRGHADLVNAWGPHVLASLLTCASSVAVSLVAISFNRRHYEAKLRMERSLDSGKRITEALHLFAAGLEVKHYHASWDMYFPTLGLEAPEIRNEEIEKLLSLHKEMYYRTAAALEAGEETSDDSDYATQLVEKVKSASILLANLISRWRKDGEALEDSTLVSLLYGGSSKLTGVVEDRPT
jgi:hypothetical protein